MTGDEFRVKREAMDLTQIELAAILGVRQATGVRVGNGKARDRSSDCFGNDGSGETAERKA